MRKQITSQREEIEFHYLEVKVTKGLAMGRDRGDEEAKGRNQVAVQRDKSDSEVTSDKLTVKIQTEDRVGFLSGEISKEDT